MSDSEFKLPPDAEARLEMLDSEEKDRQSSDKSAGN